MPGDYWLMQEKLKILYDHQVFILQKYGGVSRYFAELYLVLRKDENICIDICSDKYSNEYYARIKGKTAKDYARITRRVKRILFNCISFAKVINCQLKRRGYDIIHATWYNVLYISLLKKILGENCPKVVITIHDMIPFLIKDKKINKIEDRMAKAISISDGIICVSNNTKRDLIYFFPELSDKEIPVIYHGASIMAESRQNISIELEDYVLFVGSRSAYKNFKVLVLAISELVQRGKRINVLCVGGQDFTEGEKELLEENKVVDRFFHKDASDDELSAIYRKAKCLVYPSKYEGFGIPILEAFSCSCPVILSNIKCFREIADDAALYFEPDEYISLANQIMTIEDEDKKQEMTHKGKIRLGQFSWEKAAKETLDYYYAVSKK